MSRRLVATLCLTGALALACGGDVSSDLAVDAEPAAPAVPVAHCDAIDGMSTCVDFMDKATAEAECGSFEGTVADGACPAEARTGRCQLKDGNIRNYYSSGEMPNDAEYAAAHCKNAMGGSAIDG